ncbi:sensor histidine kinase [Streptomyces sp. CB02261]|uniref:sensor histidine kinase n=1 Tax=Streptomyces sp. CB02261 TaxID=1703940 RepID=UPI00093A239D|nr:HAMP domain-containing sensor histidine kinase [Streptomyces sp. CB02261]
MARLPVPRQVWASGLAALLVVVVVVCWLAYADLLAGPLQPPVPDVPEVDRIGPQVDLISRWGAETGAAAVALVCWWTGRGSGPWTRVGTTAMAGAISYFLYDAACEWLARENLVVPGSVAREALRYGLGFTGPAAAVLTAVPVWAAVAFRMRGLSLGARLALAASGAAGVLSFFMVALLDTTRHSMLNADSVFGIARTTGVPLVTILTGGLVYVTVARALRPVEAIRRELADITAQSLDRRVPVPPTAGIIADLARTTNATLDRVEAAATRQREFTADAAHELRSPLAALRAQLESALRHPETVADWHEVVTEAVDDVIRLQRLADDLLLLASHGSVTPVREPVDLSALAQDLVREHQHLPDAATLQLQCEALSPAVLLGNPGHLDRLLRNLLTNACRHAKTEVTVTVIRSGTDLVLSVQDDGPGIPPADRSRVFDRFTRLDEARTRATGGAGLGLPIAKDLAIAHCGTLTIENSASGALLVARFPAQ